MPLVMNLLVPSMNIFIVEKQKIVTVFPPRVYARLRINNSLKRLSPAGVGGGVRGGVRVDGVATCSCGGGGCIAVVSVVLTAVVSVRLSGGGVVVVSLIVVSSMVSLRVSLMVSRVVSLEMSMVSSV